MGLGGMMARAAALFRRVWAALRMPDPVYYINGPETLPPPLTPEEEKMLERWIADGGVLLADPSLASCDEWGIPKRKASDLKYTVLTEKTIFYSESYDGIRDRLFTPEKTKLRRCILRHTAPAYRVTGLPEGVAVFVQKNREGKILIHLLDYLEDGRRITGHMVVSASGKTYPAPDFSVYDLIVLDPERKKWEK